MKGKLHKVKCPKCKRIHSRYLIWKGNGMPRMYCNNCIGGISSIHIKAVAKSDYELDFE